MNYQIPIYKKISFLLISIFICGISFAQEKEKKNKNIDVYIQVMDETGQPIEKSAIVVGEGFIHAETNQKGEYTFKARPTDYVSVSKQGYEKVVTSVSQLQKDALVILIKSHLYKTEEDKIALPYASNYKRNTTGDYYVITGKELEKYPSLDLRNALAGLVPGLSISEYDGSTGISAEETSSIAQDNFKMTTKVSEYARSLSPIYIIDDIPIDITEMNLDPDEVESITFIKDVVGKAMYGPRAGNGVIFIKTKHGKSNERILNVNVEAGLSAVDRFPEWTIGGDYARLNNQARINSGLEPLYNDATIAGYEQNNPYDKIYPSVDFKNMMFKDIKSYQRVNVSSTGGSNFVKYYAYLGYSGEGDNFKIGNTANYHRVNARANLDMKVNQFIHVDFGFFGGLSIRQSPNYGYDPQYGKDNTEDAEMSIHEFNAAIEDAIVTPPNAFPIYAAFDEETGLPWYGVNSKYKQNPVGQLTDNGYYSENGRMGAVNVALNYDLSSILKGLKSRTYVGFNAYNMTRIGKAEQYTAYIATPTSDLSDVTLEKVHDGVDMSGQAKLHDYYFQRFSGYQTFSYNRAFGQHEIQTALTYSLSKYTRNQVENPLCEQNINWMAGYVFDNKYAVQGAVTFAGTQSLIGANQYQAFPSIGASWVVSDENFMKNVTFLDFLKIRAEIGELGYLSQSPYLFQYEDKWSVGTGGTFGPNATDKWFGGSEGDKVYNSSYSKVGNPDLNWETRREFSTGLDALLLKRKLSLGVTYYNIIQDNQWVQPSNQYPMATGLLAIPYMNYNKTRYYGAELAARFSDKVNDFSYSVGLMATLPRSTRLKMDEPNYRSSYQYKEGTPTDAYFGLVYEGRFASDDEANKVPQLFDEELHKGDLKYTDLNNDGVVDDNDKQQIGNTSPRLAYALNILLSYKNFDLTIIGDGRAFFDIPLTNKYFQNGWGDDNYSAFVKNNIDGDYPRLTYYKVNNNFKESSYWLRRGDYFKIQNIEFAYNLPLATSNLLGVRRARFFVRGANLATISGIKEIDPESPNSGINRYPLNRTFTGGVKLTF